MPFKGSTIGSSTPFDDAHSAVVPEPATREKPVNKTRNIRATIGAAILFLAMTMALPALAADLRVPSEYTSIQAAVEAAKDNDVIRIASGVYKEQVRIQSKKLTLIGQPGATLRATDKMVESVSPFPGVTYVGVYLMLVELTDVTIRGLTFEGERLAEVFPNGGPMLGLYLSRSGGVVENCSFYGFRGEASFVEDAGPIWARTFEDDDVTVRIAGCTVADSYGGIFLRGGRIRRNITATVENNTIVGLGPIATALGTAGIDVRAGVSCRIVGNTISGFSEIGTTADFPIAFGILATDNPGFGPLLPLIIEDNTLRDNQMHISLTKASDSVIRNNRIQGTAPGIAPLGLVFSGTNITVINNQFEGMKEGIRLVGNEPLKDEFPSLELGDILGFAVQAQVISNRFCNVATPIKTQSPATATVSGSQLNACRTDALTIEPAVLLSWPADEDGLSIESAPTTNGPWSATSATSFQQSGSRHIAVPSDGSSRFFRRR